MKKLPKDIRNLVTVKFAKKLLFAVIWYLFVLFSFLYYRDKLKITVLKIDGFYIVLLCIVTGILFLLPFIAVKLHQVFTDRNWTGVIVGKSYKTVAAPQYQMMISYSFFSKDKVKDAVILEIQTNKRIKRITYIDNYEDADFYYNIGDEVEHYRGLKYLYNKTAENRSDTCICMYCGALNSSSDETCSQCKHTLVKKTDI